MFQIRYSESPISRWRYFDDLDDKYWYSKYLIDDIINEHAPLKRKKRWLDQYHLLMPLSEKPAIKSLWHVTNILDTDEPKPYGKTTGKVEIMQVKSKRLLWKTTLNQGAARTRLHMVLGNFGTPWNRFWLTKLKSATTSLVCDQG